MKTTFRDPYESAVVDLLGELPPGSGMTDAALAAAERRHAVRIPQALGPLAVARVRKYGDMVVTLLGKESPEPPATSL